MFNASLQPIHKVPGLVYSLTYQPIPAAATSKAASTGGNALGVSATNQSLVVCLLSVSWTSSSDDAQIAAASDTFLEGTVTAAKADGLWNPWIYLNYAGEAQDPIEGYGPTNQAKLRAASEKYDPDGFFQFNVPGGYKLFKR